MILHPPREKAWISWLLAGLWTLVIYYTVFRARELQGYIVEQWGRASFSYAVYVAIGVGFLICLVLLRRLQHVSKWTGVAWLVGIGSVYAVWTYDLGLRAPEEAVHFVEYGILALLLYRALVHQVRHPLVYVCAWLVGSTLGAVEEIVQWTAPGRFFDYRDILLNSASCALALGALGMGLRPIYLDHPPRRGAVSFCFGIGCVLWLILFGSMMNTPALQHWYETRVPGLRYLLVHTTPMSEYGYSYDFPDTGRFQSRLTEEELRRVDQQEGEAYAQILDVYHAPDTYGAFLRACPSYPTSFLHEARVHLFRRDRYRHSSVKFKTSDPDEFSRHMTVAFRENRIMERFFSNTLSRSMFQLRPDTIAAMEAAMDPTLAYTSPVSGNLVTRFSQLGLAGWMGGVLLAWIGLNGYLLVRAERGPHEDDDRGD